ncbi:MAG: arsenate reductase family protein [Sphaerochaetaceae bacterium]
MIQIIGTKKCKETAKAIRSCKERNLAYQFVDLNQRTLSDGEWRSIFSAYDAEVLVDETSAYYKKEGYAWRSYDPTEELVAHPELLRTPVLRCKGKVHLGYDSATLIAWGTR